MKTMIKLTDFTFIFMGYGHYKVIYTSPKTNKIWANIVTDMTIIDATKNADNLKIKDLKVLITIKLCLKGFQ